MTTVEDILMTKGPDVVVTSSDTTALEAARLMSRANVGSLVIKDGAEIAGVFSERDLLKRVVAAGKDPAAAPLAVWLAASWNTQSFHFLGSLPSMARSMRTP